MTEIIKISAAVFLGLGLFLLIASIFRLPSRKASAAFGRALKREEQRGKETAVDSALGRLAVSISHIIRLGEGRKSDIERNLRAASMKLTPAMHIANCIVKAGVCAVLALPAALLSPVFSLIILVLSVGVYISEYDSPEKKIADRRDEITYELPMFVGRIDSMLRYTRDVVEILNSYKKNAGSALAKELNITVADMRSGNAQEALARFEARVGIPEVSDIARGLSAVLDGNDPVGYWAALSARLTDNRRQLLKKRAQAIPAKISRLSFFLLGCIVLLYVIVIGTELISSLGVMLG